jgi:SAM-dependent methyltransferase
MLSDYRVLDVPLDKAACAGCGLVQRGPVAGSGVFESGYQLYDHAPGAPRENARQEAYADWLSTQVVGQPRSILDLGCGNGSLLLALRRRWPNAELRGVDPSPESVGHARAAGLDAQCGSVPLVSVAPADLVISVNVIEHVEDPLTFIRFIASLVSPGGTLLLACPDGGRASVELLFVDHRWSFAPAHLAYLTSQAGLEVSSWTKAPANLGSFQLIRLDPAHTARPASVSHGQAADLILAKHDYLQVWSLLERDLLARSGCAPSLACFGTGEAAALLRAYAPAVWNRVKVCVVDDPEQDAFGDIPVIHYGSGALDWPVLLAVRPDAQAAVARRLLDAGCSVIRWDDRIAA